VINIKNKRNPKSAILIFENIVEDRKIIEFVFPGEGNTAITLLFEGKKV
jgi:hypothetical protein